MCWFKQFRDPMIYLPIIGIPTSSKKLSLYLAYFELILFSAIAIWFHGYACPATVTYKMVLFWAPAFVSLCMALLICGIHSECLYLLIPGVATYILMLCTLLMVIFISGAFTIFPDDAAKYIGSFLEIDPTQVSIQITLRIISFLTCFVSIFSVQIPLTGCIALTKLWIEVAHRNKVLHSMHLQTLDDNCCSCLNFMFP